MSLSSEKKTADVSSFWKSSLRIFSSPRALAGAALFIALGIILDSFIKVILVPGVLEIQFGFIASAFIGMLYGPVMGFFCGVLEDVLSYVIAPDGMFFPGFTLSAAVAGLIFGLLLYHLKPTLPRVIIAKTLVNLIVNIGLNTLWVNILTGKLFLALLPTRVIKNAAALPIEIILLYFLLNAFVKILPRLGLRKEG